MYYKRTAMNFCITFAILTANFVLVMGWRFFVKSVIGIYGKCEMTRAKWISYISPLIARLNSRRARRKVCQQSR